MMGCDILEASARWHQDHPTVIVLAVLPHYAKQYKLIPFFCRQYLLDRMALNLNKPREH